MPQTSAGILLYRQRDGELEVFLVHMGGPFWANKDAGAWSIPKGLPTEGEDLLAAALREFREETGYELSGDPLPLSPVRQSGGKLVYAWAIEGDVDADHITSNTFKVQWPPNSGRWRTYPEADRAAWFRPAEALERIVSGQRALIEQLVTLVTNSHDD